MPFERTWTWELPASRERLWPYVTDTDWVNEVRGLPPVSVRYEPLPSGETRRLVTLRRPPVVLEWEERPTRWQVPEFHEVERVYLRGPLRYFRSRTSLESIDANRTRVSVSVHAVASSPLTRPLMPFIAAQVKRATDRAFASVPQLVSAQAPFARDARSALHEFLESAEDRDVRGMRPYELADKWHLPRRDVLRAFLSATREGKLNLRWSVLCPGCRGAVAGVETLEALQRGNHCDACNISFDAAFDRSVEVTFDARPLRPHLPAEQPVFCIASPWHSAHVHAQRFISAGSSEAAQLSLPAGFRARDRRAA